MYCSNCGKKASGKFCSNCGAPLEQELAQGLASTQPVQHGNKKGTIGGVIVVLIIFAIIGTIAFSFISGKIRYYETYSTPGESRGYFGREAEVLDSKEMLEGAFDQLANRDEFKGKDISFYLLSLSNERINATIQNPDVPKNFDDYSFDGTKVFHPNWENRGPFKIGDLSGELKMVSLDELQPKGIYRFNQEIKAYLEKENVELPEDYTLMIHVGYDYDHVLKLSCGISGSRENLSFESQMDGSHFQLVDQS